MVLCSNCWHSEVKPIIAIDLDGTIADYHGSLFRFAEQWFGVFDTQWSATYHGQCKLARHMDVTDDDYRRMKLAYRQGGMKRTMPIFGGAREMIQSLQGLGAEVWITTTRPYNKFDSTDPDTREWLRRHEIAFDGLIYDDDKYRVLTEAVDPERIVTVVDDLPENCVRAEELGIPAVMLVNRYNMAIKYDGRRCVNIGDLCKYLQEQLEGWRLTYG